MPRAHHRVDVVHVVDLRHPGIMRLVLELFRELFPELLLVERSQRSPLHAVPPWFQKLAVDSAFVASPHKELPSVRHRDAVEAHCRAG
eukprot:1365578-Rhodomonas_salina.3